MPRRDSPTTLRRFVGLAAAGSLFLACGGSSAEGERERLADDLVDETGGALDEDTAHCVADALHEQFGDDSFQQVLDAVGGEEEDGDVRTEVIDIFAGCDALEPIIDDGP